MTDKGEIPSEITLDIWKDYAKMYKTSELDDSLVDKFGLIIPEAFSSATTSPINYAERLRFYFVHEYKLGEDKLKDMYVVRRISLGMAEAKNNFDKGNSDVLQTVQFEDGIMRGFHILTENYVRTNEYFKDLANPGLFLSMFEPVMNVLPEEKVVKVLNTVANEKESKEILKVYEEGKTGEENI